MIFSDYHTHTTFSDGKNSPEEMVIEAIRRGLDSLGFSDHSYTFFDESYCMKRENKCLYLKAISDLKDKYSEKINIYCGIEQDLYSLEETDQYDYVIGSVHYVKVGNDYIPVDESAECFEKSVKKYFSGDYYKFAEEYYKAVSEIVEKTNADVIGHFDLVSKFNSDGFFDESDDRYIYAWKKAVDKLLAFNKPFEINTGAICRGYKEFPYPAENIIDYIKKNGGRFILSSDAHSIDGICFDFERWENLIK